MVAQNRYSGGMQWPGYVPGETPLWDEEDTVPRATYTSHDAAIMLGGIDQKTLRRWAAAAGIREAGPTKPGGSQRAPEDKRVLGWTYGQLKDMADRHNRKLGKPPAESDTARMRRLEADVAQLRQLVESHIASHAVAHLAAQHAPSNGDPEHPHVARVSRPTVRLAASNKDTLPAGWEAVQTFAKRYKQPPRTVFNAIDRGDLPAPHPGPYKRGRISGIMKVWDEEQQATALHYWQQLGRIPADNINTCG